MTVGQKIKRIRNFRGLTQKQLGIAMGFNESNADVRVRQYESDEKLPRKENINVIAKVLNVNPRNFTGYEGDTAEDIMQTLFWIDEEYSGFVNITPLEKSSDSVSTSAGSETLKYNESDNWPAYSPMGLWFNDSLVNDFLREWSTRKEEFRKREITEDEYFEWKLNWPYTCDNGGLHEPKMQWRNGKMPENTEEYQRYVNRLRGID